MELTPVTYLIVLPLVFLAGFVDSVAGGGGIISLPAYLMAGIPAHLAAGTNKVVNGTGTLVAALKYFRSGKACCVPPSRRRCARSSARLSARSWRLSSPSRRSRR